MDYWSKAATVWFLGFFPFAEIYVAVPAGIALGLSVASAVGWGVFGNYVPVLLLNFGFEYLSRLRGIGEWLGRLASPKTKTRLESHGVWFVLLVTPWIGVWAVAATLKLMGMRSRPLLLATFASVLGYGVVVGLLAAAGLELFTEG
jgi:uncharacterized membrane protein